MRKAQRGAPRRQRTSAPASTTRERRARETFGAAVRDDRAAQRTLRAAARDHAAACDAVANATRASRWTPNRQRGSEQHLAYLDAEERRDQTLGAELTADVQAGWAASSQQEARDRWRAAAADKLRDRQDRRQKAREHRPARRRLRRLRQRVADLRQRLTTLDTALNAVERVLKRLGLSRRPPAPAPPPPDLSPSLSSIMRDLDRHVERDYPTPAPEPVRVAKPARPPLSRTPPAPGVGQQPPARERPPAAPPAGSREGVPKPQLVQILIGAVCAGGSRLSRVRSEFERMDAGQGVKRLVLQAVDPELLEAVVGPRLAPAVGEAAARAVRPLQAGVSGRLGGCREGLAQTAGAMAVQGCTAPRGAAPRAAACPGCPAARAGPGGRRGQQGAAAERVRPLENRPPEPSHRLPGVRPTRCLAA